ncbi:MAG TPA: YdgA family protein [Steroidobacteraceae bacterium]|nr:YdgA family protein [Steroidobacteraceae bacterium]
MNRATRTLLAAGGVIVLSYPGIAWVTGIAIEARLQGNEQQLLDQVPYLRLVSREYHRGVYRSTEIATYGLRNPALQTLKIAGGAALLPGATITVKSTIEHGPLPGLRAPALAVIDSTVIAPPALQQELASVLGSTPVLQAHTTIGIFGGASTELTGPPFNLRLADGSTLAWGGLTSTLKTNRNAARWSGQLIAPRLALQGAQGGIELSGLEYSGSQEKAFDELYLGTGTFTIELIKGSSHAGEYSLQRVSISSTSKVDGEFFDMRVDAATDAATLPSLQLKNLAYSESLEHVHGPSFASMMQAIRVAERQVGAKPGQLQTDLQQAVRQYGGEVLLHDPVLDIRQLSFSMPEGSFLLSAKISAPGLARADLNWPAAIAALQKHAEVTADVRVDNGLLQKLLAMGGSNPRITAQLTSFEQQGYLSAAAGAVATHLEYSAGRLTLNGHPFPPAPPAN